MNNVILYIEHWTNYYSLNSLFPEKVIVTVPNNFISFYILRGMTGIFMGRDMILAYKTLIGGQGMSS